MSRTSCSAYLSLLFVASFLLQACARQETYPNRPITLVCPWAAGGGTDRVSRQLAFLLEQDLGVPVNVVNATGGGGVTGHTRGAVARPDGYTITMITVELNMLHWRGLTNISYEDYEPVMMVNRDPAALFVRTDSEWQTLNDLRKSIEQKPGALKASGTAFGGIWHVGLAGYLSKVGLDPADVTWIAMGGSMPALQELMAGALDIIACSPAEAQVLVKAGKVLGLCVMANERLGGFPEIPTLKEMGIEWEIGAFRGIAVPLGVPEDHFKKLEQAVARAVGSQAYLDFLANTNAGHAAMPSHEFKTYLAESDKNFGQIMTGKAFAGVRRKYGSRFFPAVLLGMLVSCLIALALSHKLKLPGDAIALKSSGVVDIAVMLGGILFYIVAAETTGFVCAAVAMMLLFFWRLKVGPKTALSTTLVVVPLLYHLFAVYLRVPLPRGWIGW